MASGIHIKKENRGKLRSAMGAKSGKKLSAASLKRAKKNPPGGATQKQITFAMNARKWNKGRRKAK